MKSFKILTSLIITGSLMLLMQSCTPTQKMAEPAPIPPLQGTWELTYIAGPQKSIAAMYPDKVPTVIFDSTTSHIGGSTGCNSYSGSYKTTGYKIDLSAPIAATKMYCMNSAVGETQFLLLLPRVDNYSIVGDMLIFKTSSVELMKFQKKM